MREVISLDIGPDELLIRGIVHPMFYSNSKGKLKREAFIPPPQKRDVSLLRRRYCQSDSFCKKHCKSIRVGTSSYCGMAVFLARHVSESNDESINVAASVKATPIDEHNNYVDEGLTVYADSLGLPMHADLLYSVPVPQGVPATLHRVIADNLLKLAKYFHDLSPDSDQWEGDSLSV